jgi:hypothetical protein
LVGALGSGLYHETPILVQYRSTPVVWFTRDEFGHALLNIRMLTTAGQERMYVQDNDFIVRGAPTDFESPPSGHKLRVRYENGDYLRVEFREFRSLETAINRFSHIPPANIKGLVGVWPMTFALVTMKVAGTGIQFGPTMTKLPGFIGRGLVISHCGVGISL